MRQDMREKGIEIKILTIGRSEHLGGDGSKDSAELGFLYVLQHDALAPFLLDHALVVGQIVGGCLNAMIAVSGGEDLVHHADRRGRSQSGIAILWVNGQVILDLLQVLGEGRKLGRFLLVADVYVSLVGGFVSE